jgi:ABC-type antimicrobial peptide transport system permease subunit
MGTLLQDVRYGIRQLRRSPGFTAVAVITLALGIGANTTIFSVVNGILFTPGPFADEDRVVYLTGGNERSARSGQVSYSEFTECQKQNQVFDRIAVFAAEEANLDGPGEPVSVKTVKASADLITLLRANPMLGRVFLPEEYSPRRNRVVLLSNALWRRLGSRSDLAGMTMDLDGHPHAVVGVLPSDFKVSRGLGFEPEIWIPFAPDASDAPGSRYLFAVARLKAGISLERARADLEVISRRLEQQAPTTNKGWKVTADKLKAEVDPIAYVFLTVLVASVLGIACANVTNLLLAQASAREREISIRSAMGATRLRLVRQLLTECLLLATLGAGLGVLVAHWACDLITTLSADTNAGTMPIEVSPQVLLATLALLVVAGVTVGLAPALQVNRINLTQSLKGGSRSNPLTFSRWSVMDVFVVSEVAMSVSLPAARYRQPHQQSTFFDQLLGQLENRTEIQFAAVADSLPTASASESFWIEGTPKPIAGEEPQARVTTASHRYFQALSIALKSGRFFTAKDAANATPVAIINEAMVRKHWAGGSPVGARLEIAKQIRSIVGVVGDVKSIPLSRNPVPEVYVPFSQNPVNQVSLLVRAARGNPLDIAQAVKNEVQAVDPRQAVSRVRTMEKALSQNMGVINLGSLLMAVLAVGGLVLAAVGTYGVLSYAVAQRTREFGIRIALGARPSDVLGIVMKRGMVLTLVGALLGVVGALAVARFLASRIYGLSSLEVFIPLSVTSLLVIVALAACYIPARRATKVDPMEALRCE